LSDPGYPRAKESKDNGRENPVLKKWLPQVGLVLVILGLLWTLQGLDVIGGSAMSGRTVWAVIGPIVALSGLALVVIGLRGRRTP
jgi:hypothetical protein